MKPLSAAEIRERYLRFFEERGHARYPSDSLVPADDPTLLFTGAGMNQFKDMFLGRGKLPHKRITTSQKCLRVPDLENVGRTPRHHTFFEMLGNFSFGDYFKKECIAWEWEFFTEELGFPADQLVVTVYTDDDEAAAIWEQDIGLAPDKIFRFGEKENFWPAEAPSKGPNGPCGPCSEIYFDSKPGEPYPDRKGLKELPDDRFTEVGNFVFTQFERKDGGVLDPLPQKNIDVGLGLERIAAVLADAANNFETDLFRPYLDELGRRTGTAYGADAQRDVRMRRVADHLRAVVFCISDGALPSNEGRGYVVRKILRRAARDGFELGIEGPFLFEMVDLVCEVMGGAYPELRESAPQCRALIKSEEESFGKVYDQGMVRLRSYLESGSPEELGKGSGAFAFELHDTFGFPADITRQALADHGIPFDEAGFDAAMEEQRNRARAASATSTDVFAGNVAMTLRSAGVPESVFVGYDQDSSDSKVLALAGDEDRTLERAEAGTTLRLVLDRTPFYAQGGGQVGDRGVVQSDTGRARITGCSNLDGYHLHEATIEEGYLEVGQGACAAVDSDARRATERNHTATHLLHAALKNQLGSHVSQAGSEVSPDRLRFDYTHGERLSREQIASLEDEVNRVVMDSIQVVPKTRALDEARAEGFVAMFGEKYGEQVRTLSVGDYSKELCGGTHVANSGNIGLFRIVSDSAISAGTRRIEAVTGSGAMAGVRAGLGDLEQIAGLLKVPPAEVRERVEALVQDGKRLRKELEKATAADVGQLLGEVRAKARELGSGARTCVFEREKLQVKDAQELMRRASQELDPFAGVLLSAGDGGVSVVAAVSKSLTGSVRAGDLVKEVAGILGGGGGGRPEMAQGKGRSPEKLADARAKAAELLAALGD